MTNETGSRPKKISIIIPVYNEFRSLPQVLERVMNAPLPPGCEKEVVVVDDGSTDGTTQLLSQYADVVMVHHAVLNFGKGTAVRVGLAIATGDIMLVQDGDLEYDPQEYPQILAPLVNGEATVVYGTRFHERPKGMAFANWVANKILTWTTNILFRAGITDEATAYKAFHRSVVESMKLECRRFEFCPEVTAKALRLGHKIREVPISYNARGIAEGKKIRWQDGVQAMWTLLRWRLAPPQTFAVGAAAQATVQGLISQARAPLIGAVLLALVFCGLAALYWRSPAGNMMPLRAVPGITLQNTFSLTSALTANSWILLRYAAQSYAGALLIVLADLLLGLAIVRAMSRRNLPPAFRAATALALGCGLAGAAAMILGMLGALTGTAMLAYTALTGAGAAAYLHRRRSWRWVMSVPRSLWPTQPNRALAALAVLALSPVLAFHLLDLLMPVVEFDSTMYHIAAAKAYRAAGALPYVDSLRFNAQPHLPVLLYLRYWLIFDDDSLLKMANFEFMLILALAIAAAAHELKWRDGWILALLATAASPVFCWTAKIEYLDLALTAFFLTSLALMMRYLRRPSTAVMICAGLLLGFTGASKFLGLVLAAITAPWFLLLGKFNGLTWRRVCHAALIIAVAVSLTGIPWWVRSWAHTGTPFYPFMSAAAADDATALVNMNRGFGTAHSFWDLLWIGWSTARMLPYPFGDPYGMGPVLILLEVTALAVIAFSFLTGTSARPSAPVIFLAAMSASYLVFWFATGQVLRYLVPVIPVFAVLLIACVRPFVRNSRVPLLPAACCLMLTAQASLLTSACVKYAQPPPVRFADKQRFLSGVLPFYRATEVVNKIARPGERTYLLFAEGSKYYNDTVVYGDWFGRYSYRWLSRSVDSLRNLSPTLQRAGFRYLIVKRDKGQMQTLAMSRRSDMTPLLGTTEDLPSAKRLFDDEYYSVFRLE